MRVHLQVSYKAKKDLYAEVSKYEELDFLKLFVDPQADLALVCAATELLGNLMAGSSSVETPLQQTSRSRLAKQAYLFFAELFKFTPAAIQERLGLKDRELFDWLMRAKTLQANLGYRRSLNEVVRESRLAKLAQSYPFGLAFAASVVKPNTFKALTHVADPEDVTEDFALDVRDFEVEINNQDKTLSVLVNVWSEDNEPLSAGNFDYYVNEVDQDSVMEKLGIDYKDLDIQIREKIEAQLGGEE